MFHKSSVTSMNNDMVPYNKYTDTVHTQCT